MTVNLPPLAARVRPRKLVDVVGHADALQPVRAMLDAERLPSLLLYGPAGVGKTTIANAIALQSGMRPEKLSATSSGVKDVRRVVSEAEKALGQLTGGSTLLFIDEIHRFNKGQQDALLPGVESGVITLIGATTENPFFEVNGPLLSRCRLIRLESLTDDDIRAVLERALTHEKGFTDDAPRPTPEALERVVHAAAGDARTALNMLDAAMTLATDAGASKLEAEHVDDSLTILRYDRSGDAHHDQVSAFIKSMRGSDPEAAAYWLVRMLRAGEDPRFLARRMVIFASEDVGTADDVALSVAVDAFKALDVVGLPEARLNLVHAAIRLSEAPKSNRALVALGHADAQVDRHPNAGVPSHLRDAHYKGAKALGHGVGYKYPHDYPDAQVEQQYLPDELA